VADRPPTILLPASLFFELSRKFLIRYCRKLALQAAQYKDLLILPNLWYWKGASEAHAEKALHSIHATLAATAKKPP
jgi:hypothetical protein